MDTQEEGAAPEISVGYDDLINQITERNREDSERAESAGESRAAIKEFLERTGLHPKVFSFGRQILKRKKHADQMDMIRSLKEMAPLIEACVEGNHGQADMLDEADKREADEASPANDDFESQLSQAAE